MSAGAATLPRAAVQAKAVSILSSAVIALGVFLSGFVVDEPAPYELLFAVLIPIWALFGLRISPYPALLLSLLMLYNVGGLISMTQMAELHDTPIYLAVSLFLALTAVFFAAICEANPRLFELIFKAWVAGALVTGTLGIAGYFHLFPGAETFTLYDRAKGAFKDPNVFGPYLALPGVYLLFRMLTGNPLRMPGFALIFLVIVTAIFVSFSRGAWGLFAVSSILMVIGLFLQSASGLFRLRLIVMSIIAVMLVMLAILVTLQIPGVADFFLMRAQLVQDYDAGEMGRFARYGIGFQLAMERPLGIGPLMFGHMFGEDTHNIWLKALMDYSWLGFGAFFTLVIWTLVAGFRNLFRDRPWQPYLLCAYCVFIGHIGLGTVIDMDHWRHFYLLIGLIWGCLALEYRHQNALHRAHSKSVSR